MNSNLLGNEIENFKLWHTKKYLYNFVLKINYAWKLIFNIYLNSAKHDDSLIDNKESISNTLI